MKKRAFKLPENQLALLNKKNTLTEQITIKGNKAYIFTMYDLRKAKADDNVRGEILEFDITHEERMKLAKAWFCKSPLCPMCNWR